MILLKLDDSDNILRSIHTSIFTMQRKVNTVEYIFVTIRQLFKTRNRTSICLVAGSSPDKQN